MVHLDETGKVPLAWAVAHAPDGTLSSAWQASTNANVILELGLRTAAPKPVVLALVRGIDAALRLPPVAASLAVNRVRLMDVVAAIDGWLDRAGFEVEAAQQMCEDLTEMAD